MSEIASALASRDHIQAIRTLIARENGDRAFDVKTPKDQIDSNFAFLSENPSAEKVELAVGLATVKYHSHERRASAFKVLASAVKAGGETRAAAIAGFKTMIAKSESSSEEITTLITLCEEDPSDELVGILRSYVSHHGVYYPNNKLMDTLVKIGTKAAVEAIMHASAPRHFSNDYAGFDRYKSELLKQIGTEDAAAGIASLVGTHTQVPELRVHINNLIELGDIGFPHLEALASHGLSPELRDRWDRNPLICSLAFQAICLIQTPRAREVEAKVRGLFQGRIAQIDVNFNARDAQSAPHRYRDDQKDEAPYEIRSECKELFAYSFADPDAALKTLVVGLAKSTKRPTVQSLMCDTVRKICDTQSEWAEQGRQILCDANTDEAIETLFRDVTDQEEVYQVIRQAIHMANHPVDQVEAAFEAHPGLEKRVVAGLDLSKPETSLNAALCLKSGIGEAG